MFYICMFHRGCVQVKPQSLSSEASFCSSFTWTQRQNFIRAFLPWILTPRLSPAPLSHLGQSDASLQRLWKTSETHLRLNHQRKLDQEWIWSSCLWAWTQGAAVPGDSAVIDRSAVQSRASVSWADRRWRGFICTDLLCFFFLVCFSCGGDGSCVEEAWRGDEKWRVMWRDDDDDVRDGSCDESWQTQRRQF